jgi:hypothetical protein
MNARVGLFFVVLALAATGRAADFSREVRPGVTSFKRITTGTRPQKIYAVRADLNEPRVGLYMSDDVVGEEWRTNTLHFAERTPGAIAAINGDWSCNASACTGDRYLKPLGLAVSGGQMWHAHRTVPSDPNERWGYLSCTVDKRCTIKTRVLPLNNTQMADDPVRRPTVAPLRARNAIGGNGVRMITDGVAGTGCYDGTRAPRSAVCLEQDGTHLWIVVVDGRNADGGETGMTCDEMRDLLSGAPFQCWNALMLDGGGSSTLVVEDDNASATCNPRGDRDLCVKNSPSDGSLRTVGNHLAITWKDTIDPACTLPSGSWCDGARVTTCEGGRPRGARDCAAAGATCQQDGAYAFCVDARCPGGDGLGRRGCTDASHVGVCNDGVFASTDCAATNQVCGGTVGAAGCMDARCPAPDGVTCLDATWLTCAGGVASALDCAAQGQACDVAVGCFTPGVDAGTPTADAGTPDGTTDAGATADAGTPEDGNTANDEGPPEAVAPADAQPSAGCTTTGMAGAVPGVLLSALLGLLAGRRRR